MSRIGTRFTRYADSYTKLFRFFLSSFFLGAEARTRNNKTYSRIRF